jgi:parallel beta-helix repeat protein
MKRLLTILLILPLFALSQRAMVPGWNENKVKILSSNFYYPALIRLPADYNQAAATTKRYPIIFSFHGSGQAGSDTIKLFNDGWVKNLSHNGSNTYTHEGAPVSLGDDEPIADDINGNEREAIVVAVQATSYGVRPEWFPYIFADVTGRLSLRIDSSMVYLYGYSAGNWAASGIITNNTDTTYNRFISAIIVNSGATQDLNPHSNFKKIADRRIPTLLVAGVSDVSYYEQMDKERDTINFYSNPDVAIFDSVPGQGHTGFSANALNSKKWTKTGNLSFIEWAFLQKNNFGTIWTPPVGGSTPVANAGSDQTTHMPDTLVTLLGSGSTGTITSIAWRKISGGSHPQEGRLLNNGSLNVSVGNIGVGTYTYELSITDGTTTDKDTVVIYGFPYRSRIPNKNGEKFNLTPSGGQYIFSAILSSYSSLNGGDTLNLTQSAGTCQFYSLAGWGGDSVNQVVITAAPGVVISGDMRINGQHIKVEGITFRAANTNQLARIVLPAKHRNIEVTNCTFQGSENAIYAKATVDTNNVLSYGNNWDFYGNYFHHNTISDTRGEGMYLNHTFSDEEDILGSSDFSDYTPLKMSNLTVSYNTLRRIGWDGIQTSHAPNVTITHNTIDSTGLVCKSSQLFGIIIGGLSSGRVDSNDVRNTKSAGIALFGNDTCKARGNYILNAGYADIQTDLNCGTGNPFTAVYANDNRVLSLGTPTPGLVVVVENNCIQGLVNYSSGAAIESRDGNNTTRPGSIQNNKLLDPIGGRPITGVNGVIKSNTTGDVIAGNAFAACVANISPTVSLGEDITITLPVNFTTLTGIANDPDGTIVSYQWEQISGPSGATINTPLAAETNITTLLPGVYRFRLTVTDDDGATDSDEIEITVRNNRTYKTRIQIKAFQ